MLGKRWIHFCFGVAQSYASFKFLIFSLLPSPDFLSYPPFSTLLWYPQFCASFHFFFFTLLFRAPNSRVPSSLQMRPPGRSETSANNCQDTLRIIPEKWKPQHTYCITQDERNVHVHLSKVLSSSDNLTPDNARVTRQGGEAQRAQLQPFSVRFKNIIIKLAWLSSFF